MVKLDNFKGKCFVVGKDEHGKEIVLDGVVPIQPMEVNLKINMDGNKCHFLRTMFSCQLGTAFTSHKSQGMSSSEIAVDPYLIFAGHGMHM